MNQTFRCLSLLLTLGLAGALARAAPADPPRAPEFTHREAAAWINTAPLTLAALRGKVVLVEFWTFDCINCLRSLPWMKATLQKYARDDLVIVGVHTPELAEEKVPANVAKAVQRLQIPYPVMIDADYSYWNALRNRYWPAFYLVDREGKLRGGAAGELHVNDARARAFEAQIDALLSEPAR